MPKFKEGDKILQVSAYPNIVCFTGYDVLPSAGKIEKITPKMYRVGFSKETHDVRIEEIDSNFVYWTQERQDSLAEIYSIMRDDWNKLYTLQINYLREDNATKTIPGQ